ncbi:hypothetical protein P3342_006529 [Pyrenophora teres f. teres]|nr:hypothetical protein P3342_006529 [Pyrenophora teres f. teres]
MRSAQQVRISHCPYGSGGSLNFAYARGHTPNGGDTYLSWVACTTQDVLVKAIDAVSWKISSDQHVHQEVTRPSPVQDQISDLCWWMKIGDVISDSNDDS